MQKGHILQRAATHSNVKAAYGLSMRDTAENFTGQECEILMHESVVGAQGIEPWTSPV